MDKQKATPKYDISFPISQEEYDFYLQNPLSHRAYYQLGQKTYRDKDTGDNMAVIGSNA